jgi:hypothetical protein
MISLAKAPVHAQTAIGQIVSLGSKQPLGGVRVALVDDSARVVGVAVSDSTLGAFFVDAPRPGRYRIALYTASGASFVSQPMVLDSTPAPQAIYALPDIPRRFAGIPVASQVTKPAEALGGSMARFPDVMKTHQTRGTVAVAFIVDSTGRAETDSMQVLFSTNALFTESVKRALEGTRFVPAERDGVRVPQVAQLTYAFRFDGDPLYPADVVITALGITRRVETGTATITVPNGALGDPPSAATLGRRPRPTPVLPP